MNAVILGASFDTVDENRAFAEEQAFPYRLLCDTDTTVGAAYGVTREPGEQYAEFPKRISFLIDPQGTVRKVYEVTDVAGHAAAVLADLRELTG